MKLTEKINAEIKEAMKNRDMMRLNVLRMLKSKIMTVAPRGDLADNEVLKLFKTYFGNLQEALEQAQAASRGETVEELKAELSVIEEFLPKAPSSEETKQLVQQAIAECGAKSKREIGMVMKALKNLNPNIDGKLAKEWIDQLLD